MDRGRTRWRQYMCTNGRLFHPQRRECVPPSEFQCPTLTQAGKSYPIFSIFLSVPTRRFLHRGMRRFLLLRSVPLCCRKVPGHDPLGCCRTAMRLFRPMPKIQGPSGIASYICLMDSYRTCKRDRVRKLVWTDKLAHRLIVSVTRNVWRAIGFRGHAVSTAAVG